MVLLSAELMRPDSPLVLLGAKAFSENYQLHCEEALEAWNWDSCQLQQALENVRRKAISINPESWLLRHRAFPGVVQRLNQLSAEGYQFAILTTKSADFTAELLSYLQLKPNLLYGHESGSKSKVLLELSTNYLIRGFVEDRRATLETVLNTPGLHSLPCYLASWGYLKHSDKKDLPSKIHLLEKRTFMTPLASWP
tara:strand:- start:299 stop:886 length:588 start_codon:yes stop_codon:yes gene_type:complete